MASASHFGLIASSCLCYWESPLPDYRGPKATWIATPWSRWAKKKFGAEIGKAFLFRPGGILKEGIPLAV